MARVFFGVQYRLAEQLSLLIFTQVVNIYMQFAFTSMRETATRKKIIPSIPSV